ncbi:MAG TPA: 30S ribosomal protein S18 [Firmicutes bacterium]|nr:30S ribosomal protein S18 [Bacillota bacterium]
MFGKRSGPPSGPRRRRRPRRFPRRKVCRFCVDKTLYIDYKNYRLLRDFLSERGKIIPRRISGTCAKHQRMLTMAIKRARDIALLAYTRR